MGKKRTARLIEYSKRLEERLDQAFDDYIWLRKDICNMHHPDINGLCRECSRPFPCPTQLRAANGGHAVAGEDIPVTLNEPHETIASQILQESQLRDDLVFEDPQFDDPEEEGQ